MRKLTTTQQQLFNHLSVWMDSKKPMHYDDLKYLMHNAGFRTFDSSFNALLEKGWVKRTNKFENNYIIIKK